MLTAYKSQQAKNSASTWFYASTGFTPERVDDIDFIQLIARHIDNYTKSTPSAQKKPSRPSKFDALERLSNIQHGKTVPPRKQPADSLKPRETKALEEGKRHILTGIFALEMAMIASPRSALYQVSRDVLGEFEPLAHPEILHNCYTELLAFLTNDYIKPMPEQHREYHHTVCNLLVDQIFELQNQMRHLAS